MKKFLCALMILLAALCAGCGGNNSAQEPAPKPVEQKAGKQKPVEVRRISQEEAMKILTEDPNAKLLDCRFPKDYELRHIPNAIHYPLEAAVADNFEKIPNKDDVLITYCGDGNRGNLTAKVLIEKGYTNVYTMGGIIDWTGPVEGTAVEDDARNVKKLAASFFSPSLFYYIIGLASRCRRKVSSPMSSIIFCMPSIVE